MPKRAALSALTTFHRQAAKTLTALQKAITQREQELSQLKAQAARWQRVLQESPGPDGAAARAPSRRRRARGARLDWSTIFTKLPSRFTSKELAQKAGKPIAHAYTYVSRWMKDKKVRKVKEGYQKVAQA